MKKQQLVLLVALAAGFPAGANGEDILAREQAHYQLETIPIPKGTELEVGGLGFAGDGTMYVTTRRGEIWSLRPAGAGLGEKTWKLFASGLHEVLGVLVNRKGDLLVAQRPELTHIVDDNGDGVADRFSPMTTAFGVSGNYHEYHFGPVRDKAGNLYGTLNVGWTSHGASMVPYRGWAYKLTPKGDFVPFALGLRSPAGIGISPEGDIFVTDNQGDFWATSPLLHIKEGVFYGHPAGMRWEKGFTGEQDGFKIPMETLQKRRHLPALWFVYGPLGHSPTEPVWDTTAGGFGPFAGQMLVGDQTRSMITRIALEKIDGEFQGVAFPFRHGLASGILRMAYGSDKKLYTGGTDRGWGAVGGRPFSLERLSYTGKLPFEMHTVSLTDDGFEITFTQPIDKARAMQSASYAITHHGYHYWKTYGSPHVDTTVVKPSGLSVSADGRKVRFALPLRTERVYTFKCNGIRAATGDELLHADAYYTLNRLRRRAGAATVGVGAAR